MPPEKGKSKGRGRKRKAAETNEAPEEGPNFSLSQSQSQSRIVPRFTARPKRACTTKPSPSLPPVWELAAGEEKKQAGNATEEAEELEKNVQTPQKSASEETTAVNNWKPPSTEDVLLQSDNRSAESNNSFVPGLALSQSLPSPPTSHSTHIITLQHQPPNVQDGAYADVDGSMPHPHNMESEAHYVKDAPTDKNLELLDLLGDVEEEGISTVTEKQENEYGCTILDKMLGQENNVRLIGTQSFPVNGDNDMCTDARNMEMPSHSSTHEECKLISGEDTVTNASDLVAPPASSPTIDIASLSGDHLAEHLPESLYFKEGEQMWDKKENDNAPIAETLNAREFNSGGFLTMQSESTLPISVEDTTISNEKGVLSITPVPRAHKDFPLTQNTPSTSCGPFPGLKLVSSSDHPVQKGSGGGLVDETSMETATPTQCPGLCGGEELEAMQEMLDLTAADLLESQLGDEAMVPSCSPAGKKLVKRSGLQSPRSLPCQEERRAQNKQSDELRVGSQMLTGLIDELSAINRYILSCKRELDAARRQRHTWLKSQNLKGRRGK